MFSSILFLFGFAAANSLALASSKGVMTGDRAMQNSASPSAVSLTSSLAEIDNLVFYVVNGIVAGVVLIAALVVIFRWEYPVSKYLSVDKGASQWVPQVEKELIKLFLKVERPNTPDAVFDALAGIPRKEKKIQGEMHLLLNSHQVDTVLNSRDVSDAVQLLKGSGSLKSFMVLELFNVGCSIYIFTRTVFMGEIRGDDLVFFVILTVWSLSSLLSLIWAFVVLYDEPKLKHINIASGVANLVLGIEFLIAAVVKDHGEDSDIQLGCQIVGAIFGIAGIGIIVVSCLRRVPDISNQDDSSEFDIHKLVEDFHKEYRHNDQSVQEEINNLVYRKLDPNDQKDQSD